MSNGRYALVALAIGVFLAHLLWGRSLVAAGPLVDFYPYYAAGALAQRGLDFYERDPVRFSALVAQAGVRPPPASDPEFFFYPPFAVLPFIPLA